MSKEAIILAGGLGTRLRSAVPDLPKCMAPVAGKPFLSYVIDYLQQHGVEQFIFSLGYKHEVIEAYLNSDYSKLRYQCAIEKEPLGTGGAIRLACSKTGNEKIVIVNGDTLFKIGIDDLYEAHDKQPAACTLSLKHMRSFDRYGAVAIDKEGYIQRFHEKQHYEEGLINGGVYLLDVAAFLKLSLPEKFSFEQDYLEKKAGTKELRGIVQEGYFIDIGIPADFAQAQKDFAC